MGASFGPAGNSNSYFEQGYKDNSGVAEYVVRMGLDTFEYQCGRGVRLAHDKAHAAAAYTSARRPPSASARRRRLPASR